MAALAGVVIWQLELWIERLLFESHVSSTPFAVTVSALILGVIIALTVYKSTRLYLG
jgi:hypothetical protein